MEERCRGERCLGKRCLEFRCRKERWPRMLRLTVAVGMRPIVAAGGILPVLRIGIKICTDSYMQN